MASNEGVIVLLGALALSGLGGFHQIDDISVKARDSDVYSVKDFIRPLDVVNLANDNVNDAWNLVCTEISYVEDPIEEYWQFPLETWGKKTGDCEDTSFLLASILRNNLQDVYVAGGLFKSEGQSWGHAWVVWNGYIFETTLDEIPDKWLTEKELSQHYQPFMYWNDQVIFEKAGYENILELAKSGKKEAIEEVWKKKGGKNG